jgi:hypothetical protein
MVNGGSQSEGGVQAQPQSMGKPGRVISKKALAVIVAIILVSSSAFGIWFLYLRHWNIKEVERQVINDPTPAAPGFKHNLAGKSIVVEGKVTNITTKGTSLGDFSLVEIDHDDLMPLVVWGTPGFEVGDRIDMRIHFEWSVCNDESHVYSPQLAFPNFYTIPSMEIVLRAVNFVADGAGLETSQLVNGDVQVSVNFVSNPIPLEDANSSLRGGHFSWAGEYIDILGEPQWRNETDHMATLVQSSGESGIIHFTDANLDGYLDEGDYFILKNLTRPTTESGFKTYVFKIGWPGDPDWNYMTDNGFAMSYLPMISKGLLRYIDTDTPGVRIVRNAIPSGFEFTVVLVDGVPLDWDNVTADLYVLGNWEEWPISTANLTGAPGTSMRYPAVTVGSFSVLFNLTDAQGDGLLDEGDKFSFTADGTPFSNESYIQASLMSKLNDANMWTGGFPVNSTPVSRVSSEAISTGIRVVFGAPHTGTNNTYEDFDVPWRQLRISLSDGNDTTFWTLGPNDLNSGAGVTLSLSPATLGPLTVICNVSDIQGNGYLNGWDSISIATTGMDRFSSSATYTMNLTYLPAMNELCSVSFTG